MRTLLCLYVVLCSCLINQTSGGAVFINSATKSQPETQQSETQPKQVSKPEPKLGQPIRGDYGSIQTVLMNRLAKQKETKHLARRWQLQNKVRNQLQHRINVCYDRFQRCSKQLSSEFCIGTTRNISFYLWAKKLAHEIMNGNDGIRCPDQLLHMFVRKGLPTG